MAIGPRKLSENLQRVRETIAAAAAKARRAPDAVRLVAVTKTADLEDIKSLIELGLIDLGESRVQQFLPRAAEIAAWLARRRKETPPVTWHMIGHLQRNKVRHVLEAAGVIHSIDTLRLAEDINVRAAAAERPVSVLLQVNCSGEARKSGVAVGATSCLAEQIATLSHVRLIGLMTMAPLTDNPEDARPTFVRLREIFEDMRAEGLGGKDFQHLSMGMSQDYAVAVEEGATLLRIGSAIFS